MVMLINRVIFPSLFLCLYHNVIYLQASSASSPYTSISSLDKYGNCVQIRNARLSSLKHGTPIIAAISTTKSSVDGGMSTDAIVVCSLEPPKFKQLGRVHEKIELVHFLTSKPDMVDGNGQVVAMVTSGLQADGAFLVSSLRRYSMRVWERFDVVPSCDRMAQACSQLFLTFMGYNVENEVGDGVKEVIPRGSDDERFQMARPFGVSALILGISSSKNKNTFAEIKFVEPSGIVSESVSARALGKESERANVLLKERWKNHMDVEQVKNMCISIMREITQENINYDDNAGSIVCEIVHGDGNHEIEHIDL